MTDKAEIATIIASQLNLRANIRVAAQGQRILTYTIWRRPDDRGGVS